MNQNLIRAWLLPMLTGALLLACSDAQALDRTNQIFKVFQFPADQIPRIDGNTNDWDFGDGETSTQRNPIHTYKQPGHYVVVLDVSGPAGKSRFSRVWDVAVE